MDVVVITGAGGLVGGASARAFATRADRIIGLDNDMRAQFFGPDASTRWSVERLQHDLGNFEARDVDVRDSATIESLFAELGGSIKAVIHTAAQPSHDWAARDPATDFSVNATGTLVLLEATRKHCPDATFIFTSTNKVYGDTPNALPLVERATRLELDPTHRWAEHGFDETMTIDD